MSKVLLTDIVITNGTVMREAPSRTTRQAGHYDCGIGLGTDTSGGFNYDIEEDAPELEDYFAELL